MIDDENNTFAYTRTYNEHEIIVVFNKSKTEQTINLKAFYNGIYFNALNPTETYKSENNILEFNLPAETALILKHK